MAKYKNTSPWFSTPIVQNTLDLIRMRPISVDADDPTYTIQSKYHHRPDLLAYDLYGTSKLWWVFAHRNPDIIRDPVFDIVPGITIMIPLKEPLFKSLGM